MEAIELIIDDSKMQKDLGCNKVGKQRVAKTA